MKIIMSNTSRGAYLGVLGELKGKLSRGGKHVVLIPDRFTASVEREIISSLGVEGTFGVEVTSFTRLASRVMGEDIKRCLTPEGSVMLLAEVLSECREELDYYRFAAETDGAANELYAAITALRNSGISAEELRLKADKLPSSARGKAKDVALIFSKYLSRLQENFSDSSTRLNAFAAYISACSADNLSADKGADNDGKNDGLIRGESRADLLRAHYYCVDFYSFKAPEEEILKRLNDVALSLTVGLVGGEGNPNERIYCDETARRLKRAAGEGARIERFDEKLDAPTEAISKGLFSYNVPAERAECGDRIELRRFADVGEEVLYTALDIKRKTAKGARYRDFEIAVGDIDRYAPEIKRVFSRYGIPFFIDVKEKLVNQTKVRYSLLALEAAAKRLRRDEVLDFVKNPLFYGEDGWDEVCAFENYTLKYNINYSRFEDEFKAGGEEEIVCAEKVRKKLILILKPLLIYGKHPIARYTEGLRRLFSECADRLDAHIKSLGEMSAYYYKCAEQVDDKVDGVLDEAESVLKGATDTEGFKRVYESMLRTLKISLVPTYLDCVFVGDCESRYLGFKDIYVLGATSGSMPMQSSGGSVISPRDEELFARVGIDIYPDEKRKAYTRMLAVTEIFKKPKGKLIVSYPDACSCGALRPSSVVDELCAMLSKDGKPLAAEKLSTDKLSAAESGDELLSMMYSTKKGTLHRLISRASDSASADELIEYRSAYATLDDDGKSKLDLLFYVPDRIGGDGASSISASRLEKFFSCPYSYYFRYMLRLKRQADGEFEGTENGVVLHSVLEQFYADLAENKAIADILDECAERYFEKAVSDEKIAAVMRRPENARIFARLKEESVRLVKDMHKIYLRSNFKPKFIEAEIGADGIPRMSVPYSGGSIGVSGKIDRVDVLGDRFAIIDYKTFKSAKLDLDDVYYGEKIQLYLYMRAIESLGLKPAGVFYLPVFSGFVNDDVSRYRFSGQLTSDEDVITDMDTAWREDASGSVLPLKFKAEQLNGDALTSDEEFDRIGDYVVRLAGGAAEDMARGYVAPRPSSGACARCEYADACAFKGCMVRSRKTVDGESFSDAATETFAQSKEERDV